MQALRAVLMIPVVAVLLVVGNGGYVYKTTCPQSNGHTKTSWDYRIFDVIPYVGFDVNGCTSHTATRELLSALGVWRIHSTSAQSTGGSDQSAFSQLVSAKTRMDSLDARETAVKPIPPLTTDSVRNYGARLQPYAEEYVRLATDVATTRAGLGRISDPDLAEAWNLIRERVRVDSVFLTRISTDLQTGHYSRFVTETRAAERKVNQLDSRFKVLSIRLNEKFGSHG